MKNIILYTLTLLATLILCHSVQAVPVTINYQGVLNSEGEPFSGQGFFAFVLVNGAGTVQYWSNDGNNPPAADVEVTITDGLFHVQLGNPSIMDPMDASIFDNDDIWLRVYFNDGTNGLQRLIPDQQLVSTAFSLKSGNAELLDGETGSYYLEWNNIAHMPGGFADGNDDDQPDNDAEVPNSISVINNRLYAPANPGYVGIGTTSPASELDVNGIVRSEGLFVPAAPDRGLQIEDAVNDGVYIFGCGNPTARISSTLANGFEVTGAGGYGVYVGRSENNGVHVHSTAQDGFHVLQSGVASVRFSSTSSNGLEVEGTQGNGVFIGRADLHGLVVNSAQYSGLFVDESQGDGVSINSAGSPTSSQSSINNNGVEVAGAEGSGVFIGHADQNGMKIMQTEGDSIHIVSTGNPTGTIASTINNGLEIEGTEGNGVLIGQTDGDGVHIVRVGNPSDNHSTSTRNGVEVEGSEGFGMYVGKAELGGYRAYKVGNPSEIINSGSTMCGFEVNGSQGYGLYVGNADNSGVFIGSTGNAGLNIAEADQEGIKIGTTGGDGIRIQEAEEYGVYIDSAYNGGLYVNNAGSTGVYIENSNTAGVYIDDSLDTGLFVNNAENYGIRVMNAGTDGIRIENSEVYGVYTNTNMINGYGFYTHDRTYSGDGYYPSKSGMFAQHMGTEILETGDLVAIVHGVSEKVFSESDIVIHIEKATSANRESVIGVVESRAFIDTREIETDDGKTEINRSIRLTGGEIAVGDYLAVTVFGSALVKVEPGTEINPGNSLTVGESGMARKTITQTINGMTLAENVGLIGKALEKPDDSGSVLVFVNCR